MSRERPTSDEHPPAPHPQPPAELAESLTPRQRRFVEEYLIDLNATAAYRRAGYSAKTDNAASASASALLRNPKVTAAIRAAKEERSARTQISADRVLEEVAAIAFSDIRAVAFDEKGMLVETTPGASRAVASYNYSRRAGPAGTAIRRSVRLWDKISALTLLMRHLGLLNRPLTLETVLAVLPTEIRLLLERLIAETPAPEPLAPRSVRTVSSNA